MIECSLLLRATSITHSMIVREKSQGSSLPRDRTGAGLFLADWRSMHHFDRDVPGADLSSFERLQLDMSDMGSVELQAESHPGGSLTFSMNNNNNDNNGIISSLHSWPSPAH